jgi:Fe-S-cluster formation regulator IscX/YfhJ
MANRKQVLDKALHEEQRRIAEREQTLFDDVEPNRMAFTTGSYKVASLSGADMDTLNKILKRITRKN